MSGPGISDHALLRFLQRTGAMDVEGLRQSLAQSLARAHAAARSVSKADYVIRADGMLYMVRGNVVVTVTDDANHYSPAKKLRTAEERSGG